MKIDDDKLFDYAYGELPENEIEEVEDYLANNPEALKIVNKYISLKQGIESLPEETIIESLPEEAIEENTPTELTEKNKTSWWVFLKLTFGGGLAGAAIGAIATFIIFGTNLIIPQATFTVADLDPIILGEKYAFKQEWVDWKKFLDKNTVDVGGQKDTSFEGLTNQDIWIIEDYMSQIFDENFDYSNYKSIEIELIDHPERVWLQPFFMTEDERLEILDTKACYQLVEYLVTKTASKALCRRAALLLNEDIIFLNACKTNDNIWKVCSYEDVN